MIKICLLGSLYYERHMKEIELSQQFENVYFSYMNTIGCDDWERLAQQLNKENYDIVLLGPSDHLHIQLYLSTPVYIVRPSIGGFLALHDKIEDYDRTAFIFRYPDTLDFSALKAALHVTFHTYYYNSPQDLPALVLQLKNSGFSTIIGNNIAVIEAQHLGMNAIYYFSQKNIEDAIDNAIQVVNNMERENRYLDEISSILENVTSGVVGTVGSNAEISYVNTAALHMLHQTQEKLLNKPLGSFVPQSALNRVIKSNMPENDIQLSMCGVDIIGNIIPVQLPDTKKATYLFFENISKILEYENMIQRKMKREVFNAHYTFSSIIGNSVSLQKAIEKAHRFANSNSTIFINAETGTGKEVFAQSIHSSSPRSKYPFVAINCASLPDALIESELFGYSPGSFTGASSKGKIGLIEIANHGTVFLDDIDSLSISFQSKLMRVIQEKEIVHIGGNHPIPVDVRFIVATNRDLKKMVENGEFRNDLFFRINVLRLIIPPLRNRPEDIVTLFEYYLRKFNNQLFERMEGSFLRVFSVAFAYWYPGNTRELISVAERFVALVDPSRISDETYLSALVTECLDADVNQVVANEGENTTGLEICGNYSKDLYAAERIILQHYLQNNKGNISQLAKQLGISRATLYHKLYKFGISADRDTSDPVSSAEQPKVRLTVSL